VAENTHSRTHQVRISGPPPPGLYQQAVAVLSPQPRHRRPKRRGLRRNLQLYQRGDWESPDYNRTPA